MQENVLELKLAHHKEKVVVKFSIEWRKSGAKVV